MASSLPFLRIPTHLRPELACEIFPDRVVAARRATGKGAAAPLQFYSAPLPEDAIAPSTRGENCTNPAALTEAVRNALSQTEARTRNVTVIVPDPAARVFLLDFDSLPTRAREAMPILRFRLRKMLPFEVDEAAVSYQILRQHPAPMRVLAIAMPGTIRAEYESAVRTAGFEPGVMMTSTLASLAALETEEPALIVNRSRHSMTTAITHKGEILLHRSLELSQKPEREREELAQSVTVATAYFEDSLGVQPAHIDYTGQGGAKEFTDWVNNDDPLAPRVRNLVSLPTQTQLAGLTAGVTGALKN